MRFCNFPLAGFVLAFSVGAGPARAANDSYYPDTPNGGGYAQGVAAIPFPFTPLCPGSHGVSLATAITLPLPTGIANGSRTCVVQAVKTRWAAVCARTATVYYTLDGSTTASANSSTTLTAGQCLSLSGPLQIADFQAYSNVGGTLDVEYGQ